jgi:hypothetical protein
MAVIDWDEARRYAGLNTTEPMLEERLRACGAELMEVVSPRFIWKRMPVMLGEGRVRLGDMEIVSTDLRRHLAGCDEAVLLGATLGVEGDRLIRRAGLLDMSRALLLQACAASLLEAWCDQWGEEIAAETGLFLKPRYSPGYGDFSIQHQQAILERLEAAKRIGLTTTAGMMLTPTKSVTAVIGLTTESEGEQGGCSPLGCEICGKGDCAFRRSKK